MSQLPVNDVLIKYREDLQYFVNQEKGKKGKRRAENDTLVQQILPTIDSVKAQQETVLERLQEEQTVLENDLRGGKNILSLLDMSFFLAL